jgi:hypothetical protein
MNPKCSPKIRVPWRVVPSPSRLTQKGTEANLVRMSVIVAAVGLWMTAAAPTSAQTKGGDFSPFVGEYVGQVVIGTASGLSKRDLLVVVRRESDGFSLEWTTETQRPDGRIKSDRYFVAFRPSPGKPGFYVPTDKIDRLGARVPLNPLDGDPQLIAKIDGQTMTVYAQLIADDGAHEVQTYERTLVPGGMKLKFNRVRNGEPQVAIEADLKTKEQGINLR